MTIRGKQFERAPGGSRHVRPLLVAIVVAIVAIATATGWYARSRRGVSVMPASDSSGEAVEQAWLVDVAVASGVHFSHMRGPQVRYWFPEIMSGGAGMFDYDGDGDLDLYLVQGGDLDPANRIKPGNQLFRNRGDGTFEDVTQAAGVGDTGYGMGCACGDYDGDGDIDLYVTNVGPNVLYRNNGDGTFTDVTAEAGVGEPGWGSSCAFVDFDGDEDLDLFVVNYVVWSIDGEIECFDENGQRDYCQPGNYGAPAPDTLYRNEGDGTFVDVSATAGLRTAFGNGLGVACGDFNLDGRVDLYVANDGMLNQLWLNVGDGRFVDGALLAGCAVNIQGMAEAGMGVAAVDIDHDGDLDLFMTHLRGESNTLYLNQDGLFEDVTAGAGLSMPSIARTGFGMGFVDFDHDGELDLYIANGRVTHAASSWDPDDLYADPNQLSRGVGGGRFEEVRSESGPTASSGGTSRAAAFGDYDNDGDVDVLVVDSGARARLLRNDAGSRGHWVMFRVLNRRGTDAVGAQVRVQAGGRRQWRLVQTAYSYCASNDPRVHFGLGAATQVDEVAVRWPDGKEELFGARPAGRVHELREGRGES